MKALRFDTRDKKPKLYGILFQAAALVLIVILLVCLGGQKHSAVFGFLAAVFFAAVVIQLAAAFVRQLQYNPYSYNSIYYLGFALFLSLVVIFLVDLTVRMLRFPEIYTAIQILHILLGSAKNYMIFSLPVIFIFSVALCISNISLIRHEGMRLVNLLGIVLAFLLVGGNLFLFRFDYYVSGSQFQVMIHEFIANFFAAVYLYFECMLIGVIAVALITARYEPDPDVDFLIILGCGLRDDGTPSPLLRGRIDRALAFYEKQKALTGKELTFVTSGGQGPDEAISESASMKRYLMERGVPEERIAEENRSTSTFENMRFSRDTIRKIDPYGKIAFSTTNYHVFRSGLFARRVKMRAVGMGAKTKWYFWPNAAVREFVGLLTEHRKKQALILSAMIAVYLLMTYFAYR